MSLLFVHVHVIALLFLCVGCYTPSNMQTSKSDPSTFDLFIHDVYK
jgi:hypothetical protein